MCCGGSVIAHVEEVITTIVVPDTRCITVAVSTSGCAAVHTASFDPI